MRVHGKVPMILMQKDVFEIHGSYVPLRSRRDNRVCLLSMSQNTRNAPFPSVSYICFLLHVSASETKLDLRHGRCITKENLLLRESTV